MRCANCGNEMESHVFDRHHAGTVAVDLCFPCHLIWFDANESLQLTPGGILDLFKEIHAHRDAMRRPIGEVLDCPRCAKRLALSSDLSRGGRITYYRCPNGHGRLTPFHQFLREKAFVRSLTPAEVARVRAELRQVQCSSCGAPIDVERGARCAHCGSPLAILDADAVEKALASLSKAEARRTTVAPEAVATALAQMGADRRRVNRLAGEKPQFGDFLEGAPSGSDLVDAAVERLFGALEAVAEAVKR